MEPNHHPARVAFTLPGFLFFLLLALAQMHECSRTKFAPEKAALMQEDNWDWNSVSVDDGSAQHESAATTIHGSMKRDIRPVRLLSAADPADTETKSSPTPSTTNPKKPGCSNGC
jgi:hypothetical protein